MMNPKLYIVIAFLSIIFTINQVFTTKRASCKWTGLKCEFDNVYAVNGTCAIRAVRGKLGYLQVNQTITRNITDVIMNLRLLYKFGTKYRPFLIDFTVDICNLFKNTKDRNKIGIFIATALKAIKSDWAHPCPFTTGRSYLNWYADDTLTTLIDSFKFILPSGDARWEVRMFNSNNYTYEKFQATTTIKALNGEDLSFTNMG